MKIHHIGIIVTRDEWYRSLLDQFGGKILAEGYVERYGAHCVFMGHPVNGEVERGSALSGSQIWFPVRLSI